MANQIEIQAPQQVFHFITADELYKLFKTWKQTEDEAAANARPRYEEMTRMQAQKHLADKGYMCSSEPAFIALVKRMKLTKIKRGRQYWYKTSEIQAIPPKTVN